MTEQPPSKDHLLQSLYDAFVQPIAGEAGDEQLKLSRVATALTASVEMERPDTDEDAQGAWNLHQHRVIQYQLFNNAVAKRFLDPICPNFEGQGVGDGTHQRGTLLTILSHFTSAIPPTHRQAFDYISVPVPRHLFARLVDALEALEDGEVQDLVRPAPSGKHQPAWSWTMLRIRALEHVAFIVGRGSTDKAARGQVSHATGVGAETLRDWRRRDLPEAVDDLKDRLDTARDAGRLSARREADPDFGKNRGEVLDAGVVDVLQALTEEPLHAFGRRFRQSDAAARYWSQNGGD